MSKLSCMKILSRKRGITLSKNGGLSPLLVWVLLLLMVNNYSAFRVYIFSNNRENSEFQVNIFSYKRDIRKCRS